jgi:hypothetical protein
MCDLCKNNSYAGLSQVWWPKNPPIALNPVTVTTTNAPPKKFKVSLVIDTDFETAWGILKDNAKLLEGAIDSIVIEKRDDDED